MANTLTLPVSDSLKTIQDYVRQMHKERGFVADPSKELLMLTEEVGELAKAIRKHAGMKFSETTRQTEAAEEVADVFIVLLALASLMDIDVHTAFLAKETKNQGRVWA
jgi:NTP pyrophosphatase (non-canonical NTP hydrolase)